MTNSNDQSDNHDTANADASKREMLRNALFLTLISSVGGIALTGDASAATLPVGDRKSVDMVKARAFTVRFQREFLKKYGQNGNGGAAEKAPQWAHDVLDLLWDLFV